ncbi:MAG: hypothetical protein ACPHCI_09175 [Solirubrobacterales bacterium]
MSRRRPEKPQDERGLRILLLPFTHFRELDGYRRVALVGALTIAVCAISGIPDFGWLEATQLLVAVSCVRMIARAIESQPFACPFHDGTLLAVGGMWAAIVTLINAFDGSKTSTALIIVAGCSALFLTGMLLRFDERSDWLEYE